MWGRRLRKYETHSSSLRMRDVEGRIERGRRIYGWQGSEIEEKSARHGVIRYSITSGISSASKLYAKCTRMPPLPLRSLPPPWPPSLPPLTAAPLSRWLTPPFLTTHTAGAAPASRTSLWLIASPYFVIKTSCHCARLALRVLVRSFPENWTACTLLLLLLPAQSRCSTLVPLVPCPRPLYISIHIYTSGICMKIHDAYTYFLSYVYLPHLYASRGY